MSLEEVDDLCLLTGGVKFRDDKKWKLRHATLRRLSPVANTLHLQLFKDGPRGMQSKASLSLDNFRAMETGFTLDRESNTLALLCDGNAIVLAFDAREALIQWQVKIAASVPYVQQFCTQLLLAPPRCKLTPGPARLHVQDLRVSLVMGCPPRLVATWAIADLRRYGPAEGKYVLEGGARCGRAEGLYVLGVSGGQAQPVQAAVQEAAQCRLQSRRRLAKKLEESPVGTCRRPVSRSCSRDSTLTRSRDSGLCRQSSLQWSTWSSDDCDLEYEPIDGSRANGDGQSEVSQSSSGSDSAPRRLRPSTSGQSLRSPRHARRCGSDCACAIKTTRSSLRRTGVLDTASDPGNVNSQRSHSAGSLPPTVAALAARYADHVYEEPREKPVPAGDAARRPIPGGDAARLIQTVAEVHESPSAYDRPRPATRRLSPEGVPDHLYEDPGPAEGWYQTPRPCAVCRERAAAAAGQEEEGVYKRPACPCAGCGGHRAPQPAVEAEPQADRPRVDGSGRMPLMNANTGQVEVPDEDRLCPRIPSEMILGTGLYSQLQMPAYAIVDKSRKTCPLLPGVDAPPAPGDAAPPGAEHQYANVTPPPSSGDPTYVNTPRPPSSDGASHSSLPPPPPRDGAEPCYANAPPPQPMYANAPWPPPGDDYVPMRPPAGAGDYLEMGAPRRGRLRRSRSAESGRKMALRSLSLGRKPMPSPKPERVAQLAAARPGPTAPPVVRCCTSSPGPRSSVDSTDSGVTSCDSTTSNSTGQSVHDVPPLKLHSADNGRIGSDARNGQRPLSARSDNSSSPRALPSLKPRSGTEYQCIDRAQLLAQINDSNSSGSAPGAAPPSSSGRGCTVDI